MHRNDGTTELTRRGLLAAGLGAAVGCRVARAEAGTAVDRPPNIVFLLVDQWRASATGYAGDPNVKTPHLDRLARQSVDFRSTVSVCPVCTPYRAALMTGRYPTATGMFLNDLYLPAEEVCLAETLDRAGYETAYIGKWHLDGHGRESYIPPERRQGWGAWRAAECDHNYLHSHYYDGASAEKRFWDGYDAFAQTRDAGAYIREHVRDDRPFALFVSYGPPHFPHFLLPPEFPPLARPEDIRLPANVPPEMVPRAQKEASGYYAHCQALDRCVGDLVAALDHAGLADNTILVFTSDHGEMMGSHGVPPYTKQVPWNESAHVPLLLRYPRVHGRRGRAVSAPVTTPDIHATLLGLAGVPLPSTLQGEDLSRVVRTGRGGEDRAAVTMAVSPFLPPADYNREYRAIRTRRHTYVRGVSGPWLLYDDVRDPLQLHNLAADVASASLLRDLDARLDAELSRVGDTFQPREHYLNKHGYTVEKDGHISYAPGAPVQSPRR